MLFSPDKRWVALILLCLGDLMIILDTTIVNVALPSIKSSLQFTDTSLVWVVNAYMLTFSGFLLLWGRLRDIYGHRRVFLIGLSIFTLASLACGIANTQSVLIVARAVQGLGGAVVSAVALSIIMNLFVKDDERAKAMGVFGFVAAGGGAIGVFLGGLLTGAFDWHWIFLVNMPVGVIVFALCYALLPHSRRENDPGHLDLGGALTVTFSLMLAVYAIVNGNQIGWLSPWTISYLTVAVLLFAAFIFVERIIRGPLVPLEIFRKGNVATISMVGVLWSAGMFAWFFLSALYMQLVLGYTPMQVGLSFLPANVIMAVFSLGLSARIVMRYGTKYPLFIGLMLIAIGLLFFANAPINGDFLMHILPAMCLLGIGAGLSFNPVLLAGTAGISQEESGLVSGVLNTAFMMGGSLGLAILASLASLETMRVVSLGASHSVGLLDGYQLAFMVGAIITVGAALLSLRIREGHTHAPVH
jgi:EmrB/QacA subfamily drug resistance transporter